MRVFLTHKPGGAYGYISESWKNTFEACGHVVKRYDSNLDNWYDFEPDLYIGCSGHKQNLPKERRLTRDDRLVDQTKIAIHCNPYGPVNIQNINESNDNIVWTIGQNPDVVFGYGFEDDRLLWSYWTEKHDIPWVPMPTAGDSIVFNKQGTNKDCNLVYLGGRWQYKAKRIDAFLLPVIKNSGLSFKLAGWGNWPRGISQGTLEDADVTKFLSQGMVGPCISEPHTGQYGIDIPERMFKVSLCGALVIHDPIVNLKRYVSSAIVARNESDFMELCRHWCSKNAEKDRLELAEKQRQEVLSGHTYFHRLSGLLHALGFHDQAEDMLNGVASSK